MTLLHKFTASAIPVKDESRNGENIKDIQWRQ